MDTTTYLIVAALFILVAVNGWLWYELDYVRRVMNHNFKACLLTFQNITDLLAALPQAQESFEELFAKTQGVEKQRMSKDGGLKSRIEGDLSLIKGKVVKGHDRSL